MMDMINCLNQDFQNFRISRIKSESKYSELTGKIDGIKLYVFSSCLSHKSNKSQFRQSYKITVQTMMIITIIIFFNFLSAKESLAFSWNSKISEAEKNYKAKNYEKAFENYKQAQIEDPKNIKLKYNMGNTAYKLGKYDEASNIYKGLVTTSDKKELKEKYVYNLGNSYYKQGKLEEAEKSYVEALKIDSNDLQAKKNLEKVREELKKRKKDEQNRKDNKSKQPDKKKKEQDKPDNKNKDNKPNDQNKPDDKGKDSNNQPKSKPENKNNSDNKQANKKNAGISKEEAEKWLNSIKDNNSEITRKQVLKKAIQGYGSKKDW